MQKFNVNRVLQIQCLLSSSTACVCVCMSSSNTGLEQTKLALCEVSNCIAHTLSQTAVVSIAISIVFFIFNTIK